MKKLKQNEKIAVAVAVPLFLLFFIITQVSLISDTSIQDPSAVFRSGIDQDGSVGFVDTVIGEGVEALLNTLVTVHYIGVLEDGTVFDNSYDREAPFQFILGAGQVIPGWEEGVQGMRVGGQRILIIPPEFAYGAEGIGDVIPPQATLTFQIELIAVEEIPQQ